MNLKKPYEVFTPRAAHVNESMYISRAVLEERLVDALDSNKYVVIHGESGNGKTWLYKRVFIERGIHYDVVNLSQVVVAGSLEAVFEQKLGELLHSVKTKDETTAVVGARPWNIGVEYQTKSFQEYSKKSPFLALLSLVRDRARGEKPVLVLDNFESIVRDDKSLQQLAGLIVSADDEAVAQYGVQVVIVGVPGNLKEIITKLTNSAPVSNRLTELPEVARMSEHEAHDLIERGFVRELSLSISDDIGSSLYATISWTTDRIAQHIHEICLIIANNALRNGRIIDQSALDKSLATWVEDSLSSDMAVIEASMNAIETKAGRKNQVLYAMGECKTENFKYSDIEAIVRDQFDVGSAKLNVSQILAGFSTEANPIIRRTPKGDAWRFVSPKLKMAIRSKLQKESGKVTIRQ